MIQRNKHSSASPFSCFPLLFLPLLPLLLATCLHNANTRASLAQPRIISPAWTTNQNIHSLSIPNRLYTGQGEKKQGKRATTFGGITTDLIIVTSSFSTFNNNKNNNNNNNAKEKPINQRQLSIDNLPPALYISQQKPKNNTAGRTNKPNQNNQPQQQSQIRLQQKPILILSKPDMATEGHTASSAASTTRITMPSFTTYLQTLILWITRNPPARKTPTTITNWYLNNLVAKKKHEKYTSNINAIEYNSINNNNYNNHNNNNKINTQERKEDEKETKKRFEQNQSSHIMQEKQNATIPNQQKPRYQARFLPENKSIRTMFLAAFGLGIVMMFVAVKETFGGMKESEQWLRDTDHWDY